MEKNCPQCGAVLPAGALGGLCPACLLQQGAAETATQPESTSFQPPTVEEIGRLFPQLEVFALVGKGGMGAVYKARQKQLDRFVALKILPPGVNSDPSFAERFTREAKALARLNHPHIVTLYEFGQVPGATPVPENPDDPATAGSDLYYFLMEFVDGVNLRQLERAGRLSAREALQIVPQICEALQFAHDEGVVHRDIKPENILLDKKGRVKIADFGIAKIMGREASTPAMSEGSERRGEDDLTEAGKVVGTPRYMAPEQMKEPGSVDHRADIFALGVVFYEMLTGELPLGKFVPPSRKVQVDVRLDDVVLRALEREPERRYQTAGQFKTQVETIAVMVGGPPPVPEDLPRQILARDYHLSIRYCLRRGWKLLQGNFWPLIGISALMIGLLSVTASAFSYRRADGSTYNTSILALLLNGPLIAGWNLYFLKRIRGERTTVETAFAGFSKRFLHLFLANFVASMLVVLGLICLVLPGVYLFVAWIFTLTLVIDKGLDFWAAMELSRKAVNKHWWKVFGLLLVLTAVSLGGLVALCVGILITVPLAVAALMYAYEDIFSPSGVAIPETVAGAPATGPTGTAIVGAPRIVSHRAFWKFAAVAVGLLLLGASAIVFLDHAINRQQAGRRVLVHQADLSSRHVESRAVTGPPFIAPLRQGSVELVAVGTGSWTYPDTNASYTWWKPDGTPTQVPAYGVAPGSSGTFGEGTALPRQLIFRTIGLPAGTSSRMLECKPAEGYSFGDNAWLGGQWLPDIIMGRLYIPTNATTLRFKLGIAAGPWTRSMPITQVQALAREGTTAIGFTHEGVNWTLQIQGIQPLDSRVRVIAVHSLHAEWDSELVVVDEEGKEWKPLGSHSSRDGMAFISGTCDLTLDRIREIRLRIRPYEIVEFRNVSLHAGWRTQADVRDAPDTAAIHDLRARLEGVKQQLEESRMVFTDSAPVVKRLRKQVETLEGELKSLEPEVPLTRESDQGQATNQD